MSRDSRLKIHASQRPVPAVVDHVIGELHRTVERIVIEQAVPALQRAAQQAAEQMLRRGIQAVRSSRIGR